MSETNDAGKRHLEKAISEYDTLQKIIEQFELVGYHDDIGHKLVNNVAFTALKRMATRQSEASTEPAAGEVVDMLLFCPQCFEQHIDNAMPDVCETCGKSLSEHPAVGTATAECFVFKTWLNPPHRSHRCGSCNHVWRPSDVPTNGVQRLETKGNADGSPRPVAFANGQDFNNAVEVATAKPATDFDRDAVIEAKRFAWNVLFSQIAIAMYGKPDDETIHSEGFDAGLAYAQKSHSAGHRAGRSAERERIAKDLKAIIGRAFYSQMPTTTKLREYIESLETGEGEA